MISLYIIIFILQPGEVGGSVPGVRCQKEGQGRLEKGRGERSDEGSLDHESRRSGGKGQRRGEGRGRG